MDRATDTVVEKLREAHASAVDEYAADLAHWEASASGQDSDECERSGQLYGYAEGLAAAISIIESIREE